MRIYVVVAGEKYKGYIIVCMTTNEELARKEFESYDRTYHDYIILQCCDYNNNNWVELDKKEY